MHIKTLLNYATEYKGYEILVIVQFFDIFSLWDMFGIYVIIATIFRSYIQPLNILFTIPFGIIGAVFGHLGLGLPITHKSCNGNVDFIST